MTRLTLVDLDPDEYNQGFCYYPFIVKLDGMPVVIHSMIHPMEYV